MKSMEFNRPFVLFSYQASHGLLVFRSGKSSDHSCRVDVVFQDVRSLECRSHLSSLHIEEVASDVLPDSPNKPLEFMSDDHKIYRLCDGDCEGYVIAVAVFRYEDEREFFDAYSWSDGTDDATGQMMA